MIEWIKGLSVLEHIFFWLGVVSTILLIVQVLMLCFSSFGGDVDADGDGALEADTDSGVSIFTLKSITAFFAVGSWAGLLTCSLASEELQWLSILISLVSGAIAFVVVALLMRAMMKLQCNGALQYDKLLGKQATVYVSVPQNRSGRGKITLSAQGRFLELDAMTDGERLACDEAVEISAIEGDCMIVKKIVLSAEQPENINV